MFESMNSSGSSAVSRHVSLIHSYTCCLWSGGVFAQVEARQCVVKKKDCRCSSIFQPVPVGAMFSWITSLGVGSSRAAPADLLLSCLLQVGLLSNSPRGLQLSKLTSLRRLRRQLWKTRSCHHNASEHPQCVYLFNWHVFSEARDCSAQQKSSLFVFAFL